MRRKSAFVFFLATVGIALVVVYCMEMEPHKFPQDRCPNCHMTDGSGSVMGRQLTAPVTHLCERCHEKIFEEGFLHPIDMRPRNVRVPADFPLSSTGEFTCSTCHDIHSSYFTPYGAPSRYLRRYEVGKKFCEACHAGAIQKAGHAGSMGEAHFQAKYIQKNSSQMIDPQSKNCISCHDGAYASSISIGAGTWGHRKELMPHDGGSHPIGVDYENSRVATGRKTPLRPIAMVDRRIRFFEGKIGCGSCHDPYSTIEKRLVMSDARSRLCLSCHMMAGE